MKSDRVIGTILGLAIGDAMGMATEFLSRDMIKEKYGRVTTYQKPQKGLPTSGLEPGQFTDDTQMSLALLDGILAKGYFCPFTIAEHFKRWGNSDQCRTPGKACFEATKNLDRGESWWMSGYPSAGCGAAMRIAPLALYHMDSEPYQLINDTISASIITHNDPQAVMGAVIIALSIYYCLRNDEIETKQLMDFITFHLAPIEKSYEETLSKISSSLSLDEEAAFNILGNGGYVIETISAALYSFLRNPKDFKETILIAVNGGNDADSVAAISGALSGAYNGKSNIPYEWIVGLENYNFLEEKGKKLYQLIKRRGRE